MNRFAELLDRLAYEPGRNNKLRLITGYFRKVGDPDRGYALAALTGALSFKHAKPGLIRDLIADRADPVLFALSYDYVGDLSETVALMWPKVAPPVLTSPLPPRSGGEGLASAKPLGEAGAGMGGLSARTANRHMPRRPPPPTPPRHPASLRYAGRGGEPAVGHNYPPPPTLTEVVTTLRTLGKTELPKQLARWLDELDETGRWALLKLVTGAMRIGISARLAKTAAAALGDKEPHEIELMWPGLEPPYRDLFAWLEGHGDKPVNLDPTPFRPVMLAHAIENTDFANLAPADFHAEWKWDGIRVQAVSWPRRRRPHHGAALLAQRRRHHQRLSRSAALAAAARRHRRRIASAARRPGAEFNVLQQRSTARSSRQS